jgi:hypothetical protein
MKLLIALLMVVSPLAQAAAPNQMELLNQFDNCSSNNTCESYTDKELLSWDKDNIEPTLRKNLLAIAEDQARIWGDTILEGDYIADGKTELNYVTAIYYQKSLIGYQIGYSQKAYYTGSCDYDYENEATLEECTEGSIAESLLVTADLKEWDITQDGYADFQD